MTISILRKKWPGQKITFKVNRQNIITIACVVMILCLYDLANTADAQSSQENILDSDRVGWTNLLFRTKKFFGNITAEVQLDFITPIEAKQAFEAYDEANGIEVKHYHADNGVFASAAWCDACTVYHHQPLLVATSKPKI